jgi:hypothetical protein
LFLPFLLSHCLRGQGLGICRPLLYRLFGGPGCSIILLFGFARLVQQRLILGDGIPEMLPHSLLGDDLVKINLFKFFGLQSLLRPSSQLVDLSSVNSVEEQNIASVVHQSSPFLRHTSVLRKNNGPRAFPLSSDSEELRIPLLVVGIPLFQPNEQRRVSDRQLNSVIRLLPRTIDVEELQNAHLLPEHRLPEDVGGEEVPPRIRHYLA